MNLHEYTLTKNGGYRKNGRTYYLIVCNECNKKHLASTKRVEFCSNKCQKLFGRIELYKEIKILFQDRMYRLTTSFSDFKKMDLKNEKLSFVCPNGHNHSILLGNFRFGQKCGKCLPNINGISWVNIIELFEHHYNFKVVSPFSEHYRSTDLIRIKCNNGHVSKRSYGQQKSKKYGCAECSNVKRIAFKEIRALFEFEGYTVLTIEDDYINQTSSKIEFVCPNGHEHSISPRKWRSGQRCGKCRVSKEELSVRNFLDEYEYEYEMNDRSVILSPKTNKYLEIDLWFPDRNKAIEVNGLYWHSKQDKTNNDTIKRNVCDEMNIDLLVISDDEWNNRNEDAKDKILCFLNR